MSKIKRNRNRKGVSTSNLPPEGIESTDSEQSATSPTVIEKTVEPGSGKRGKLLTYLKAHALMVGIICLLAFGVLGSALKYLDEDAQREMARRGTNKGNLNNRSEQSFLNKVNPFLPPPDPTPTPQLSREYLYAGSQLLAVEDVNATTAPPADLAIWRKTTGEWWVMGSSGSQQLTQAWGIEGDDPVEGDYDGDGKTDFSVWRPSTGTWYIINSGGGGGQFTFGQMYDIPAPADFDGDGRTDAAVYRGGTWYIQQSSNSQTITQQFGLSTDIPAPADYDGDGKADIAVWRNSTTAFYSLNSSNGALQTPTLGQSGEPVSGDYDGDGKANYAVKSGANWAILNNTFTQVQIIPWQSSGDKPVQNDYDGDGKVDIAVWRDTGGIWFIRQSSKVGQSGELRQVQWGASGDTPVPAFYRR